jgi:pimeloyl-ACP methyl ester carboxylesterase
VIPRGVLVVAAVALLAAGGGGAKTAPLRGAWVGTYVLPASTEDSAIAVQLGAGTAEVQLGFGHASLTRVAASTAGTTLTFRLPGRPTPLLFRGTLGKTAITGTVTQGPLRGTFELARGPLPEWDSLALYRYGDGSGVAMFEYPTFARHLLEYDSGEVRAMYPTARRRYDVGAGLLRRSPPAGTAVAGAQTFTRRAPAAAARVARRAPLRQLEVRFRSGHHWLAGTLTLPPGGGKHPAVALVHGGGAVQRTDEAHWGAFFAHLGFAVLAYDKRGVGQSGGLYPGNLATGRSIDLLARDAEAAVRFLAAQPEVDRARTGFAGTSQAGWIMPLAASREAAARFVVAFVGPVTTQGQTDLFAQLAGAGQSAPDRPVAEIEAEVRKAGPSGFDPLPSIRKLKVPALWLFGGVDKIVPTALCVELLEPLTKEPGRDLSYTVFPSGGHPLLHTRNGLLAEALDSNRFVDGLFPTVRGWLKERGITR